MSGMLEPARRHERWACPLRAGGSGRRGSTEAPFDRSYHLFERTGRGVAPGDGPAGD